MKTVLRVAFAATCGLLAGCLGPAAPYGAFEPKGELGEPSADAYSEYGPAMAHCDGYDMACEWQRREPAALAAATAPERLASFVASPSAADALLARIGTAYDGDPVVLTQIAAVTQLVMTPGGRESSRRALWTAALERARAASDDGYVKTFCDQQLRICR